MAKENGVVIHSNRWFWGIAEYIIIAGGNGTCKVCFEDRDPGVAYLSDVSVHISARGQGLGNELLKIAIERARLAGCKTLRLWANPNDWPIEWYKRHGFVYKWTNLDDMDELDLAL